jgi:two-component system, chemotaxis family, chemotaxis protein CheY
MSETHPVLAVDDSLFMHKAIGAALRGSEFTPVTFATSAEEALARYGEGRPDVVLLDVVMPKVGGREALAKLRALDPTARVVMVSSLGTEEAMDACLDAGAVLFITKPFDPDQLLAALRRAVS